MPTNLHREDEARRDLAATSISRSAARLMVTVWLAFSSLVGSVEATRILREERSNSPVGPTASDADSHGRIATWRQIVEAGSRFAHHGHELERDLENRGHLARRLRAVQRWMFDHLGLPAAGVVPAGDGWMYFEPDLTHVTGRGFLRPASLAARRRATSADQPDPLPAIVDFHRELSDRGIRLVVLPVPAKPSLAAAPLVNRSTDGMLPVENESFREFLARLSAAGIESVDVGGFLRDQNRVRPTATFLKTDTHWTPLAVEEVARELAGRLKEFEAPVDSRERFREHRRSVRGTGDLARLLEARAPDSEIVEVLATVDTSGEETAGGGSSVLLLGDSFVNIYSDSRLGWGANAGLRERLEFHLQRPVQSLALNDRGATASRRELARVWRASPERLSSVKAVIWEFAARELSTGDWKIVPLPRREQSAVGSVPELAGEVRVQLEAVAPVPDSASTPYPDALLSVKCILVSPADGQADSKTAATESRDSPRILVYVWGFQNRVKTPAARWQAGQEVRLRLTPWSEVESRLGRTARLELEELDDADLESPVYFGEPRP